MAGLLVALLDLFSARTFSGALLLGCSLVAGGLIDIRPAGALLAGMLHEPACAPEQASLNELHPHAAAGGACSDTVTWEHEVAQARDYLVATAVPGYTMGRQGPELALGRLHPEFAVRLARALREARESGLPAAGIFSAYRPPAFGVGGFSDKFMSLHAYGLAVDLIGIGAPGSSEARRWHEIAATHGVICPYGPSNRAEWNHCQPTRLKSVVADHHLRQVITGDGPVSLEWMFEVGSSVIADAGTEGSIIDADETKAAAVERVALTASRRTARRNGTPRPGTVWAARKSKPAGRLAERQAKDKPAGRKAEARTRGRQAAARTRSADRHAERRARGKPADSRVEARTRGRQAAARTRSADRHAERQTRSKRVRL